MSFELKIQSLDAEQTVSKFNGHAVITPIGIDPDESCYYTLTLALEPIAGVDVLEVIFFVTENHVFFDHEESLNCFSGQQTHYIRRAQRSEILDLLLRNIAILVELSKADTIVMHAPDDLPPKALVKYEKICTRFTELGYAVEWLPRLVGTRTWRFDRLTLLWA